MPLINPFTTVTGKNAFTLFEIRLENDFLVFRGNENESSGQLLKGTVVLCLPSPLKVEDVHLRLTGILHFTWTDTQMTPSGVSSHKVDKMFNIFSHRWTPFVGVGASDGSSGAATSTKGVTLPAGNYEWPFDLMLPGGTTESVEGLPQASITYKLKATVARGKLAYDFHAYKRLRVIRTLESSALEFLHAMSVENIWPNKVEYSIVIPQKAVVFGSTIPLETRFTPLLKGLELGDVNIKLVETHDLLMQTSAGHPVRQYKKELEVANWTLPMSREEHWQDMIEDTGQEGWVMKASLDLPRKLSKCLQDVNAQGIKIRHKLKLVLALKNPDGHTSELRATLPVTIIISPNMPLDEDGNLIDQPVAQGHGAGRSDTAAPPGYGEHLLDQLYEDIDATSLQTPALQSGINTPFYGHSRTGSADNLAALMDNTGITPAALQSRLQSMTLDASRRNHSWNSLHGGAASGTTTPHYAHYHHASNAHSAPQSTPHSAPRTAPHSAPESAPLSRQVSNEHSPGSQSPEHVDFAPLSELSKVPSYQTAVKTPVRPLTLGEGSTLPDYQSVMSAPGSPAANDPAVPQEILETVAEVPGERQSGRLSASPIRHHCCLRLRLHSVAGDRIFSHIPYLLTPTRFVMATTELPSHAGPAPTMMSDDAIPDTDPNSTAGLLGERLHAWRHAVTFLEDYMQAVEKVHKEQAKEYEKVLKTISKPLKEGHQFDQSLGGVAGFFENVRANTQALVNTNLETEKNIKGSLLPMVDRLQKEIKHKSKELAHGAGKGAKDVEKIMEENNHHNDLVAVQTNFQAFEAHIVGVMQQAMETFNQFAGGQAEKVRALHSDMLGAAQRISPDFEWQKFVGRSGDLLVAPSENLRSLDSIKFPNMDHPSTKPLIEGTLERKSRNKLAWGHQTAYYVVTPSKWLHEFKDSDILRKDPTPELSIFLPDAIIGVPSGEKFHVKGKDKSKTMSSKLTGSSELAFKAHTAADAQKWFDVIKNVAGATGPADPALLSPVDGSMLDKPAFVTDHKAQDVGVTGGSTVTSPTGTSPNSPASALKGAGADALDNHKVAEPVVAGGETKLT
ncbi:hypothetical protein P8C59_008843 [Phyllachora maydis]|uniref:PH domain-containing protein n=1 Tax=Phyllachora maydis TaxID=1825666 RepID=A0AAD9ID57_9PEZI|nr:hypothetical protein P8C59_008843 [Phyllachora maydis]